MKTEPLPGSEQFHVEAAKGWVLLGDRAEAHKELDQIDRSREILTKNYREDFEALSKFTTQSLRDQRWTTIIGASLIIAGVIISTIGSLIA